uniref:Major facilitator superfamily (MFS) profile domain-containing protein n=1 Tax=Acrobeloides nanus TaxID=290746 RepID=A0A914C2Y4_9BILA
MRFLQGFATSLCNTSMGSITSQWSTIKESGFFLALLSSHYQLGQVLTMPTAGVLCESRWGWPALYYIQGVLTALIAITFYIFYRDNPYRHKFVSAKELLKIEEGKINVLVKDGGGQKDLSKKVPYKAMLTDFVVWGIVLSINFIRIGYLIFIQFGPIYLNKVMKFNVKNTGIGSALPFLGSIILKLIAGQLSDCVTCIPMKLNLIFFVTIAGSVVIFGNLSLAFLTIDFAVLAQIALVLVVSFSGLSFISITKSAQMISQHYSHIIMVFITLFSSTILLILPIIVAILAPDNEQTQWKSIFIGICVIILSGMLIFNLTVEVQPRSWVQIAQMKNKVSNLSTISEANKINT